MRFVLRFASAAFALAPLSFIAAQTSAAPVVAPKASIAPTAATGKNLAMDFRTMVITQGVADT